MTEARTERSLLGAPARYSGGLHDLGEGVYAWLQPNGGLGESNAGLVLGEGESMLIDTLWDPSLTQRMLDAMAAQTADAPIRRLVNTHADGDHCWGNQLLARTEIVATTAAAEDMLKEDPRGLRLLSGLGRVGLLGGRRLAVPGSRKLAGLIAFAKMLRPYDFAGIKLTPPTRTFAATLTVDVSGRRVELIEVGPAHTPGDLIVHIPDARTVFAADLLFIGCTPIMWVGPVENWLAGLDRIAELDPRVVVPGHGPITDLDGVHTMRRYWEFVANAVRERFSAGMSPDAAARDIIFSPEFAELEFADWDGVERIAVNAAMIQRSDRGETGRVRDLMRLGLIASMGELAADLEISGRHSRDGVRTSDAPN